MSSLSPKHSPTVRTWRSLDELERSERFRAFAEKEFADYDPQQMLKVPTRRSFMKLMAASMALSSAGLSGCRRWPEQVVAPYAERPEGRTPGVPEHFATAMELAGVAMPLLVTSYDGRPIKIEGNPSHPASGGATTCIAQASVLSLYDPDRSRAPRTGGDAKNWDDASAAIVHAVGKRAKELAILCEATSSPTIAAFRDRLTSDGVRWYEYEAISYDNQTAGHKLAFGKPLRAVLDLAAAQVIVALDADLLGSHPDAIRHAAGWAVNRRTADADDPNKKTMSRMYCVEPGFSVTGTNADDRLALRRSRIIVVARAIAAKLGVNVSNGDAKPEAKESQFVDAIFKDLSAHKGKSVVAAGPDQSPEVHAAVALINDALGNTGKTVAYTAVEDRPTHVESIKALTESLNAGKVGALIIIGGNPVYDAPADLAFGEAIAKAGFSAHLSLYDDETSAKCTWHLPRSHYLEAWGDARDWSGTASVVQPLILPLFATKSAIELLAIIGNDELSEGYDLVRRTWAKVLGADSFERAWRPILHAGLHAGSAAERVSVSPSSGANAAISAAREIELADKQVELSFIPSANLYDGRFANNAWLQETPDPVSKLVWDNAALLSPTMAKKLRVKHGDSIELAVGTARKSCAVFILPGEAEDSIRVALGYGRSKAGYVGSGSNAKRDDSGHIRTIGFNMYPLRSSGAMHSAAAGVGEPRGKYSLVTTQDHHAIDTIGIAQRQKRVVRELVRTATLEQFKEHHTRKGGEDKTHLTFVDRGAVKFPTDATKSLPLQLFDEPSFQVREQDIKEQGGHQPITIAQAGEHQWAMAIDLNTCIGCNACMVACQAENNVPVVGKRECGRGREMHWIRVDRYFVSPTKEDGSIDADNVIAAVHQPLTCQQCENAPCEQVCPVAATVHDTEGLNVMIYNRCIGTRYCSNNCPYKVRRYNWFDWNYKPVHSAPHGGTYLGIPDQQQLDPDRVDPLLRLQFNPEVTVRMRGVMEKCSFCVQRIKAVTIPSRNKGIKDIPDGAIQPACAQTCPTKAIKFGDLTNADHEVTQIFGDRYKPETAHPRAYEILRELNPRTRNRYLGRVSNPALAQPIRDYDAELRMQKQWEKKHVKHDKHHGEDHDENDDHGHDHDHGGKHE